MQIAAMLGWRSKLNQISQADMCMEKGGCSQEANRVKSLFNVSNQQKLTDVKFYVDLY